MLDRSINYSIYLLARVTEFLNDVVFKMVEWRERGLDFMEEDFQPTFGTDDDDVDDEPVELDKADHPDSTQITLREFDLGDLQVQCPECGDMDHILAVGLGVSQTDDEENEEETWELSTVGMTAFACGCIVFSECLTDKVAAILNLSDNHLLTVEAVANLSRCEEHGVLHSEE